MIISKTPLRLALFSGGSDLPAFINTPKEHGAAFSITIDKFVYVILHRTPNIGIKVMFDKVAETQSLNEMEEGLAREALKYFNVDKEITIASVSDILSKGSGLGSSSAFIVGLVNALNAYTSYTSLTSKELAKIACDIEMNKCKYPVGYQDSYAAAYGGINQFEFYKKNDFITKVEFSENWIKLERNLMLVWSGHGRMANDILSKQVKAIENEDKLALIRLGRNDAYIAYEHFKNGNLDSIGEMLNESWNRKKKVVSGISTSYFDEMYDAAMNAGAIGGKLMGAGGGGFFLFYVHPDKQESVSTTLTKLYPCSIYPFKFYNGGSSIILKS